MVEIMNTSKWSCGERGDTDEKLKKIKNSEESKNKELTDHCD
jgi:hypothetical protein